MIQHGRPAGPGLTQAGDPPAFLVESDDQGTVFRGVGIQRGDKSSELLGIFYIAPKQHDATHAAFCDALGEVGRQGRPIEAHHQELSGLPGIAPDFMASSNILLN